MRQQNKIVLSLAYTLILANSVYAKEPTSLDAITVTANKVEENVQEVPISMTVFDEFTLQDKMLDNVADIAKYTPGLEVIGSSALKWAPSLRGLHDDYGSRSSTVALIVDGIPVTDGTGFDETLMDIERVEVLRGPQGTLYGKNAEVGAINVITKKPNNETKGKVLTTLGSDNKKELAFSTSGAIVKDKFYIGVSGKHYEKDGFIKNTYTGKMSNNKEHNYGKIILRWTPTDDLEASFVSSKIKYDDGASQLGSAYAKKREVGSDFNSYNKSSVLLNALNVSYTINDKLSLTSVTAHRNHNDKVAGDYDFTSDDTQKYNIIGDSTYKTLSQELRLNYEDKNTKIVSGIFLEDQEWVTDRITDASWGYSHIDQKRDGTSLGLFSHLTYQIDDKLSVLGGLRYDKKEETYTDFSQTIDNDENEISPKIGLTYDLKENIMTYATISKGYRAGGFNVKSPAGYSKTYDKETLYSYEVGLKGSSMNGRLTYDTALYHMNITDMQVEVYVDAATRIKTNAAEATSKGIETSLSFQATDTLNLFAGASVNDIKFDKYHDGKKDFSGNRTPSSSKYNFNIGAEYRADNGYYASANLSGYGDMYLDVENKFKRDAYEVVNTKFGYETESYDMYFYVKNLFDKEYDSIGLYSGYYNSYSPPREIGVQLAYRF